MVPRARAASVAVVAFAAAAAVAAPATWAAPSAARVHVVAQHLDGPFGLASARGGHSGLVVAESDTGEVTRVALDGSKWAILKGAPGVAGAATGPHNVFAVTGGPNEEGAPSGGKYGPSRVLRISYDGKHVKVIANLLRYEKLHNPDGQVQLVHGHPVDALSNPFAMTSSRYGLFVADGGANDVLRVNPRTGHVSTFFAPPTVKNVPACKGPDANANPGTKGCDPVPTGVQVLGGSVYISTLGGEAPQAGRIYKLSARTGKIQRVWSGFTAPTGVAVRRDGTIYFSEVLFGAPEGDPGPGFDPSSIGRITRIHNGHITHAQVTMPTGLLLRGGHLYASAWSIGSFLGIAHAGQIVRVPEVSFH
ncbi:MAG: ScyD/ScyE family protein [Marmoricola sp.]